MKGGVARFQMLYGGINQILTSVPNLEREASTICLFRESQGAACSAGKFLAVWGFGMFEFGMQERKSK